MCPLNVTTNSTGCVAESHNTEYRVREGCSPFNYLSIFLCLCVFFMSEALSFCSEVQPEIKEVVSLSAGQRAALCFISVYFFAILQPCLDDVNCRVQSV